MLGRIFKFISLVIALVIVAIGVAFAFLNSSIVTLNYYFGQCELTLSVALMISLALGVLLGLLAVMGSLLKEKSVSMGLRRKLKHAEQEVENLRSIPIKDSH